MWAIFWYVTYCLGWEGKSQYCFDICSLNPLLLFPLPLWVSGKEELSRQAKCECLLHILGDLGCCTRAGQGTVVTSLLCADDRRGSQAVCELEKFDRCLACVVNKY